MFDEKPVISKTISGPPKALDVIAAVFEKAKSSTVIPARPYDAAHWWIDHQEPPNEHSERVEQVSDSVWKTPYIDRVSYTAKVFLTLNDPQRAFVIDNIKRGIPWRGDDIRMFVKICEEAEKMKRDRNSYVCQASSVLANVRGAA